MDLTSPVPDSQTDSLSGHPAARQTPSLPTPQPARSSLPDTPFPFPFHLCRSLRCPSQTQTLSLPPGSPAPLLGVTPNSKGSNDHSWDNSVLHSLRVRPHTVPGVPHRSCRGSHRHLRCAAEKAAWARAKRPTPTSPFHSDGAMIPEEQQPNKRGEGRRSCSFFHWRVSAQRREMTSPNLWARSASEVEKAKSREKAEAGMPGRRGKLRGIRSASDQEPSLRCAASSRRAELSGEHTEGGERGSMRKRSGRAPANERGPRGKGQGLRRSSGGAEGRGLRAGRREGWRRRFKASAARSLPLAGGIVCFALLFLPAGLFVFCRPVQCSSPLGADTAEGGKSMKAKRWVGWRGEQPGIWNPKHVARVGCSVKVSSLLLTFKRS